MSWAGGDVIRPPGVLPVWCGCRWALLCRSCPPPWWSPGCCLARSPTPRSRYGPSTTASCRPEPDRRATGPSVLVLLVGPATSCFHVLSGELMINTDQKYNLINPIRSWKTLWFTVCFLWATNCINNVCEESSDRFYWSLRTLVWFWGVLRGSVPGQVRFWSDSDLLSEAGTHDDDHELIKVIWGGFFFFFYILIKNIKLSSDSASKTQHV